MRILKPFLALMALEASQTASALPTESEDKFGIAEIQAIDEHHAAEVGKSLNPDAHTRAVLDSRSQICSHVADFSRSVAKVDTKIKITLASTLTLTSSSVCYYFNGQNCEYLGPSVGGVIATILTLNAAFHGAEAVPYDSAAAARRTIQSYQDMVHNALEAEGYTFNSIENIGSTHSIQKRSQDEPDLLQRFWIKGVQLQKNGTSHDLLTHYYSNGDISVHHHPGTFANSTALDLEKRDGNDHAGFKVSASVKRKGSYTLGERNEVGQIVGGMWGGFVSAKGKDNPFGDVYGHIEQPSGTDIVYFRIIPENKGYGLNYESVNGCGALP